MVGYVARYPIEIRDWYDLNALRDNLNGNHTLMNDLDSTTAGYEELASPTANGGKGWQPIGTFLPWAETTFTGFMGTFDGQGYKIRDLFINRPDEGYAGLFAIVKEGGRIEDIGVVNADVIGYGGVGGLVGGNEVGTVRNPYYASSVVALVWVGGLVGDNYGTVRNSYYTGSVTGAGMYVGGLMGENHGTVINSYSTATVAGEASCVGGLVGENYGTVRNSYSTGNVTGGAVVGGLVGRSQGGSVSNSYSTDNVTGEDVVGGLLGQNIESTVSNSFWDTETSGQATSAGGKGKTTAQMKDIATFSGARWKIITVANPGTRNPSYIWNIVDKQTYPFLNWQA
jgi:hypothetical protein